MLLNFSQSWSAPCLAELRRLEGLYAWPQSDRPAILVIQGDDDGGERLCDRLQLPFPVVPDRNRTITRLYGIRCWPTTLSINRDGRISRIDMGTRPGTR